MTCRFSDWQQNVKKEVKKARDPAKGINHARQIAENKGGRGKKHRKKRKRCALISHRGVIDPLSRAPEGVHNKVAKIWKGSRRLERRDY